jgi:hypothetical protein
MYQTNLIAVSCIQANLMRDKHVLYSITTSQLTCRCQDSLLFHWTNNELALYVYHFHGQVNS